MADSTPRAEFLGSLDRCTASDRWLGEFYDRFLASSDEVRAKFRNTDFETQRAMLEKSLRLCAGAITGDPESLREVRERGRTHDRDHLDVEPRLYAFWLDALVETAAEVDPQWSAGVEAAWRRVLGHVIESMSKRY